MNQNGSKMDHNKEKIRHESPLLRKEFILNKKVEQAIAFVTARGFYEFYINGKR